MIFRFLRNNGLTLALFALFAVSIVGQAVFGWQALLEESRIHGEAPIGFAAYLTTGHFWSAVAENMESEFLQMSAYLLLTAVLVQRGAKESRRPDGDNPEDESPKGHDRDPDAPWPVQKGGLVRRLYSHSLGIALVLLTSLSFSGHLVASTWKAADEARQHGQPVKAVGDTALDPQFWYESFQNWQSEFASLATLLLLSVWLRQRGSSQSKPVAAPDDQTGE